MSLMSILSGTTGNSSTSTVTLSAAAQKALAAAEASAGASASTTGTTTSTTSGVTISSAARAAAVAKEDNAKDFSTLTGEVRAALDEQSAKAKANGTSTKPDLSEMSGRAVAAIALNSEGRFSAAEIAAAKSELRDRMRTEFTASSMVSGTGLAGMSTYNQQLISQYDSMSAEEREARGWTAQTREGAASFVQQATTPSLWDALDQDA